MSEIRRQKNESFEGFMRRAKRQWVQSGKLIQAKKILHRIPRKSKNVVRKQRVKFIRETNRVTYLRKIGRMPEEPETPNRSTKKK